MNRYQSCFPVNAVAALVLLGLSTDLVQAAPTVTNLSPRGLQIGGTTTLTVTGNGLTGQPRLLAKLPIAKQTVKPGARPNRVQVDVTLDDKVPPGIYQIRLANDDGVSSPVAIGVDQLPQRPFAAEAKSLPIALHGNLTGATILETRFVGKAGQRVVVDLESRRLGSALNPVVELYRPGGVLLKSCGSLSRLVGDARLEAKLPQDGTYSVKLHDALYRGAGPGFFRLKIGDLHYADMAYPSATRGKTSAVYLRAGSLAEKLGNRPLTATLKTPFDIEPGPLPNVPNITGGRPPLMVTDIAPQDKAPPGGYTVPADVYRSFTRQNPDRFVLNVKPGMRLRFEVMSQQLGVPSDAVLTLSRKKGGALASADDRGESTDPVLNFVVPAGVDKLIVTVEDRLRRKPASKLEPESVYRISIARVKPSFSLTALADQIVVPQGGTAVFRVRARRVGYNGPIKLRFHEALPGGVSILTGDVIPAGATDTLLTLRAEGNAAGQLITQLLGEAAIAGETVRSAALLPETAVSEHQPWLARELAAVVTRPSSIQVAWQEDSAKRPLVIGTTYQPAVKLTRSPAAKGPVRLSLLTSQIPPVIRQKNNQIKPDTAKTLRLQTATTIAAGRDASALRVIVPPTLPAIEYDLAVRAELLSPDGKRVLSTVVTPSRRVRAVKPSFTLVLSSPAKLEARAGKGPTGKLRGRIRRVGFPHPVTLTLSGLPKGVVAPNLLIPGNQSAFEFPVTFPRGTKPGELKGVKLIGTSRLGPKNVVRATNEIAIQLTVVPEK